jgi:hypothetical protein
MAMLNAGIAAVMASLRGREGTVPAPIWRVLLPHERYRFSLRPHPAVLGGPLLLVVGGLLSAIIAGQFLPDKVNYLPIFIIWGAWLALVARLIIRIFGWLDTYLSFSDLRMFIAAGSLVRTVQYIPLSTVSDISFSQSRVGRLFDYGKFTLEVGGADRILIPMDYVPYPEEMLVQMRSVIFPEKSPDAEGATGEAH